MRWYLQWWMQLQLHENFVENIASDLLCKKGLTVEECCDNIVKPQRPLDEIDLVLSACLYRMHTYVLCKGKYWTTNRDESLKFI